MQNLCFFYQSKSPLKLPDEDDMNALIEIIVRELEMKQTDERKAFMQVCVFTCLEVEVIVANNSKVLIGTSFPLTVSISKCFGHVRDIVIS